MKKIQNDKADSLKEESIEEDLRKNMDLKSQLNDIYLEHKKVENDASTANLTDWEKSDLGDTDQGKFEVIDN